MKNIEILEKLTHVNSDYYDLYTARTLMDSPEFYLDLVSKIQEIMAKEYDCISIVSDWTPIGDLLPINDKNVDIFIRTKSGYKAWAFYDFSIFQKSNQKRVHLAYSLQRIR